MRNWFFCLFLAFAVLVFLSVTLEGKEQESSIPRLYLTGDISAMHDKSDERNVSFRFFKDGYEIDGYAKLKIQGNSSLANDKKNYTLKLFWDEECSRKMKINVGWGKEYKYCLKANWIDKTHARNIVTARIASQLQAKYDVLSNAPNHGLTDGFPIEIYSNDQFLGLYTFNIPRDAWMLNMDEENPDHIAVCGDRWDAATSFSGEPSFISWTLEVGEGSEENLQKLRRLYSFIWESTDDEFRREYSQYFNLNAVLDYYLMVDFAYLQDNIGKNMLLHTYDSKVWYPSLYDLDTSWGARYDGAAVFDYKQEDTYVMRNPLLLRTVYCFSDELMDRYWEVRESIFTKEHIMNEFYTFKDLIPEESFVKEKKRWGENLLGFEYEQIEEYLNYRIPILDHKYSNMEAWLKLDSENMLNAFLAMDDSELSMIRETMGISELAFIDLLEFRGIDTKQYMKEFGMDESAIQVE